MRRLGELLHATKDGLLVVKSALKDPRKLVGSIVYDRDMKRIGRIVDVIGRTDSPYVIVKPESKDIIAVIEPGPVYYFVERKKRRFGEKKKKPSKKRGAGGRRRRETK
ncbi:RNA-binding protein [Desulfurococcaceae archaeon MEX13E-LK6-19]|nr:RNA-binding protein [Desulfurococcaceae archaeon MEX13E-LK6-19]